MLSQIATVVHYTIGGPEAVRRGPALGPTVELRVVLSLVLDEVGDLLVLELVEELHQEE